MKHNLKHESNPKISKYELKLEIGKSKNIKKLNGDQNLKHEMLQYLKHET